MIEHALNRRIVFNLVDAGEELGLKLSGDEQLELWRTVKAVDPKANRISKEDYKDIIEAAFEDDDDKQKLIRRKKRSNSKSKAKKTRKRKPKKSSNSETGLVLPRLGFLLP